MKLFFRVGNCTSAAGMDNDVRSERKLYFFSNFLSDDDDDVLKALIFEGRSLGSAMFCVDLFIFCPFYGMVSFRAKTLWMATIIRKWGGGKNILLTFI